MSESFEEFLKEYPKKSGLHGLIKMKDLGEWAWQYSVFCIEHGFTETGGEIRNISCVCIGKAETEKRLKALHSKPVPVRGKKK